MDGQRIDRVVSLLGDLSRSVAVKLIAEGSVLIDGQAVSRAATKVSAGATITMTVPQRQPDLTPDPEVNVEKVYVDEHIIVVNKPSGLTVHPGNGVVGATLVEGLLDQHPEIADIGEALRPGIVHRLDKPTSGLLAVARSELAYTSLVAQLKDRTVTRRYVALVHGVVASEEGLIEGPIGRSLRDPTRRAIVAAGKAAKTHYSVTERFEPAGYTLVECRLETGRTHQIRVHFESIGHPLAGDLTYGKKAKSSGPMPPRLFLHAATLGFTHPATAEPMSFAAPIPPDLAGFVATIGS